MKRISFGKPRRVFAPMAAFAAWSLTLLLGSSLARAEVQVQLDTKKSGPRAIENLTEQRIVRDYRAAWMSMAEALESDAVDPLEGPFTGEAKRWLTATITSQRQSGLSQRYANQSHNLVAVFYAPEGDVMELHDTAQYQLQILDGGKILHNESVVVHYVVLMTPGADRWVIRQLQAVPNF